jgi:hypothetical protein
MQSFIIRLIGGAFSHLPGRQYHLSMTLQMADELLNKRAGLSRNVLPRSCIVTVTSICHIDLHRKHLICDCIRHEVNKKQHYPLTEALDRDRDYVRAPRAAQLMEAQGTATSIHIVSFWLIFA